MVLGFQPYKRKKIKIRNQVYRPGLGLECLEIPEEKKKVRSKNMNQPSTPELMLP
jgi:hypothetical protein